jgi:polyphosphate kinase
MIESLYEASRAGVQVDLLVRGICCLKVGVPGVSENIRVRSIIGRFLEHSRIYYFHNAGEPEVLIGSADLMERNLNRRVEVLTPMRATALRAQLVDQVLQTYLDDNQQSWELQPDGTYRRCQPGAGQAPVNAQEKLLELAHRTARHSSKVLNPVPPVL